MSILLQKPGILTTVQDLGRNGYRRYGINPGGVMDRTAARLINILLGNDAGDAVLEMHFPAPEIVFEANTLIAIGGAEFTPMLADQPAENWRIVFAKKGSILKFAGKRSGNRSYLAVKGGISVPKWFGSSSTNLAAKVGGFNGRKVESGDRLALCEKVKQTVPAGSRISKSLIPHYRPFPTVRIIPGAEFEYLSAKVRDLLLNQNFTISNNSDRMGFRLKGDPLNLSKPREIVSSAVSFGTIQLLPDGQLIVLMADHQTSGGYPRIAHVIAHDLPLLAQLGSNDKVAFHLVETADAENLALQFEKDLNFLRIACRFQSNQ
jgi:antagonist of KipI